jgi:hypothetical protein
MFAPTCAVCVSIKNNPNDISILITDELLLIRNLKFYNGNVERAFGRLVANMEVREYYKNVYSKRDPFAPHLRKLINQM